MVGTIVKGRIINEIIFRRTGVKVEIAYRVHMRVLRWYGHIERMDANCLMKRIVNACMDIKKWNQGSTDCVVSRVFE